MHVLSMEHGTPCCQVTRAEISCEIEILGGQARDDIDDDAIVLHYYLLKNIELNKRVLSNCNATCRL